MRKMLLPVAALTGVLGLSALGASAAPATGLAGVQETPAHHGTITNVDYYWNHHHYHHRHWDHDRWRYYN